MASYGLARKHHRQRWSMANKVVTELKKLYKAALAEGECAEALDLLATYEYASGGRSAERVGGRVKVKFKNSASPHAMRAAFVKKCVKKRVRKG